MRNNNTTEREYLTKREVDVIGRLSYEKAAIVTQADLHKYFGFTETVRNKIISRLLRKGIFTAINRGIYLFSPLEAGPRGRTINEFLIPSHLFPQGNYYLGYSTMYNYYGFSGQIFQVMHLLNTTRQKEKIVGAMQFKLLKVSPSRMYGLTKLEIKGASVIVSDRERTLVDLIYFPDPIGGLREAYKIAKMHVLDKKISIEKFTDYAARFPSISTRKRIGFILEECGVAPRLLLSLRKSIKGRALIALFPKKTREGPINNEWGIIVNDSQRQG